MNSSKRVAAARRKGAHAQRQGRVRIVGGSLRSRLVEVAVRPDLRPTPDRVRESLFNWLGQQLDGLVCLDLFSGSGVLGFEAASRGAARVMMVESDPVAVRALRENRERLGASRVEIVQADALEFLASGNEVYDVVFLDPPFRQNLLPAVLGRLPERLRSDARVYVEAPAPVEPVGWVVLRHGRAGQVHFQLMRRNS